MTRRQRLTGSHKALRAGSELDHALAVLVPLIAQNSEAVTTLSRYADHDSYGLVAANVVHNALNELAGEAAEFDAGEEFWGDMSDVLSNELLRLIASLALRMADGEIVFNESWSQLDYARVS